MVWKSFSEQHKKNYICISCEENYNGIKAYIEGINALKV